MLSASRATPAATKRAHLNARKGIAGEHEAAGGHVRDYVLVRDERVERRRLALVHRMRATLGRQRYLARDAHLAATRVRR